MFRKFINNRQMKGVGAAIALVSALSLEAAPVSLDDARHVAVNWMKMRTGKSFHVREALGAVSKSAVSSSSVSSARAVYRIIPLEPQGWAIVASDDNMRPIIAYGESDITSRSLPPALIAWLDAGKQAVTQSTRYSQTERQGVSASPFALEWNRLKEDPALYAVTQPTQKFSATMEIRPLLWMGGSGEGSGILWGQGSVGILYNDKCPADGAGPNSKAVAGCVATVMGQVMRYYQKPTRGTGSHTYMITNPPFQHNYGVQTANYGATTYDWSNMPYKLTAGSTAAQINAVSTLLYHAGVAVDMDYGNGSSDSGSLSVYHDPSGGAAADSALKNYFGFSKAIWHARSEYSDSIWTQMLVKALQNGDPVLYGGVGTGGHAFVLDGYASDSSFHINWGWDGSANGWYFLDSMTPSGTPYNFSFSQQAIFIDGDAAEAGGTGGGGCTYNPYNQGIDVMMILMILLTGAYPVLRKYHREV